MATSRAIPLLCLTLVLVTSCGAPSSEPSPKPARSPSPEGAVLPPVSTSTPSDSLSLPTLTPSRTPSRPPDQATEAPQASFPYLPPDLPLRLSNLKMIDAQHGWAVYNSDERLAHVLKTDDGGFNWVDVSPPVPLQLDEETGEAYSFHFATYFQDPDRAWVSASGIAGPVIDTVWRTLDGGKHWEQGLLGRRNFGSDWILFDFIDPLHGWGVIDIFHGAGSHSGEVFRTSDGGLTWERLLENPGNASGIDFLDRQVGWITTDIFAGVYPPWALFITRDGGITWEMTVLDMFAEIQEPMQGHMDCAFRLLRASSAVSGVVHRPPCSTVDEQGNLLQTSWMDYTIDGGSTWQFARMPAGAPEFINANIGWAIGPTDWDAAPLPTSWSLFITRDGGRSWQSIRELDWHGELSFIDDRNGWGVDEEGILRRTMDGGTTWEVVQARTVAGVEPEDLTMFLDLPVDTNPISLANGSRLQLLATLPADDPTSLVIYRDTLYVGNAQGQILQWTLEPKLPQRPAIWRSHDDWVYDLAAVDEGGDLVSASRDGQLRIWPLHALDGWWIDLPIHTGEVISAALSPDGSMLASGGQDSTIKVQDLPSARLPEPRLDLQGHDGPVWDVAFNGDGSVLASASGDRTLKLWSPADGALLGTLSGHGSTVSQVSFVPEGSQLASASWDGTVRIWDPTTYELLHILEGHDDWVLGLAYAPSGDLVASSSADGKVLLWDPSRGELISELIDLEAPVRSVAFDAQGHYLVAIADSGQIMIFGVTP